MLEDKRFVSESKLSIGSLEKIYQTIFKVEAMYTDPVQIISVYKKLQPTID